jgi:glycine amidinotransferase
MIVNKFPLKSYNEWGRLREVVVGNPFPKGDLPVDFSFCHFHFDNINSYFGIVRKNQIANSENVTAIKFKSQYIDELKEDIDGLALALEQFGVNVLRPKQLDTNNTHIRLPYWETQVWPALNVRDRVLVLGDNMIETTPCIRSRYLETDLLKEILYDYFRQGANWLCMPRPVMTDSSFDLSYINNQLYKSASHELIACKE